MTKIKCMHHFIEFLTGKGQGQDICNLVLWLVTQTSLTTFEVFC